RLFAAIRDKLAALPGVSISVGQPISHRIEHLESGVEAQIVVKVFGPDLSMLRALAEHARTLMQAIPGVTDLNVERQVLIPQVRVHIDPARAANLGFSESELIDALHAAVGGKAVSQIVQGPRRYDLVLMFDRQASAESPDAAQPTTTAVDSLRQMRLISPSGALALLSDVADIRLEPAPNEIARENALRRISISCNVDAGHDLGATSTAIEAALAQGLHAGLGYTVRIEGQYETRRRAVRAMTILGILALAVMLALLWTHFRALAPALQVMLNIPFAFIGAIAALLIAREPFSIASLIGLISLCGIAARNGVLMITHYRATCGTALPSRDSASSGPALPTRESVIRASQERVAPVLMTALTTGLALIPILLTRDAPGKEILYPLALTICGGLITCTLLDFFVTPSLYLAISQRSTPTRSR
ncbi:MAG TPA: efflux RND transporter permease subunit, partial [Phycisphaerales bacterium]|nr:efflux RND transporter permease subunit [Phycisphaerales bacterium]